jgi:hypothetical protein
MYVSPHFNSSTSTTEQQYQAVCKYLLRSHPIDSEQKNPKPSPKKLNANACLISYFIYKSLLWNFFNEKQKQSTSRKHTCTYNSMLPHIDKAHAKESKTKGITMTLHLWPFEDQRTRKQPKLH